MKCFNKTENFGSKVNFVDENNVILGYDTHQDCCEHAGWYVCEKLTLDPDLDMSEKDGEFDWDGWKFDATFFHEFPSVDELEDGAAVAFRINRKYERRFLVLFNVHNGYYGHGFDFTVPEMPERSGCL